MCTVQADRWDEVEDFYFDENKYNRGISDYLLVVVKSKVAKGGNEEADLAFTLGMKKIGHQVRA